jgi:hypothetical protein
MPPTLCHREFSRSLDVHRGPKLSGVRVENDEASGDTAGKQHASRIAFGTAAAGDNCLAVKRYVINVIIIARRSGLGRRLCLQIGNMSFAVTDSSGLGEFLVSSPREASGGEHGGNVLGTNPAPPTPVSAPRLRLSH